MGSLKVPVSKIDEIDNLSGINRFTFAMTKENWEGVVKDLVKNVLDGTPQEK